MDGASPENEQGSDRDIAYQNLLKAFVDQINEGMQRSGVSRAGVARKLGSSRAHITQALSGSRNLSLKSWAAIAWASGVVLTVKGRKT